MADWNPLSEIKAHFYNIAHVLSLLLVWKSLWQPLYKTSLISTLVSVVQALCSPHPQHFFAVGGVPWEHRPIGRSQVQYYRFLLASVPLPHLLFILPLDNGGKSAGAFFFFSLKKKRLKYRIHIEKYIKYTNFNSVVLWFSTYLPSLRSVQRNF